MPLHKDIVAPKLEHSWAQALSRELSEPYFKEIYKKMLNEKTAGMTMYPPENIIFNAFNLTPVNRVKVVILGQDPYHKQGQAHGLSFSVPHGVTPPPSLKNIFKEINCDLSVGTMVEDGNLETWATQGVLLLNSILTVRAGAPASHHDFGWERFTDAVIAKLSDDSEHLVFILWGKFAENKEGLIDSKKHLILKSAHPSPFSATKFFGHHHFSQTNKYLLLHNKKPISWGSL